MAYYTFPPPFYSYTPPSPNQYTSSNPYCYGTAGSTGYYNTYKQQPTHSYSQHVGASQNSEKAISVFDGDEDAYGWVLCTEKQFKVQYTPEKAKVTEAVLALQGRALRWWLWWSHRHPEPSWDTFTTALLWRFKPEWRQILPILDDEEEPDYESLKSTEEPFLHDDFFADPVPTSTDEQTDMAPPPLPRQEQLRLPSHEPSLSHTGNTGNGSHYSSLSLTQPNLVFDRSEIVFWGNDCAPPRQPPEPPERFSPPPKPPDPKFRKVPTPPFHANLPPYGVTTLPEATPEQIGPFMKEMMRATPEPPLKPPEPPDRRFSTMLSPPFFGDTISTPNHDSDPVLLRELQNHFPPLDPHRILTTKSVPFDAAHSRDAFFNSQAFAAVSHMAPGWRFRPLDLQQIFEAQSQPLPKGTIHVLPGMTNKAQPLGTRHTVALADPHASSMRPINQPATLTRASIARFIKVIAINGNFPGPVINVTTNNHVSVNVYNELDEDLLITWPGIQMRRNSWQDGVLGTNCPIPPKWNWTYKFQVKDQIGSFFYFPSVNFQRASGGFGPFVINNREIIPIPFAQPDGEIFIMIGDWYNQNHTALRTALDAGKDLGIPDGVLINGKGPYQYNSTLVPGGIAYETITVDPGKTYRIRVHNVGISTTLNFRIQNHNLLLVETEGYYTTQTNFTNFDIHAGQSYSFLLSTDQNASTDYYIVASARFVNESLWQGVTGVAVLHYTNSKGAVTGPLPPPPDDFYDKGFSMNQARSVRQNTSASGARPNPQGSFRYGSINITDTYILKVTPPVTINGATRAAINGISFLKPDIPFRLADKHQLRGIYKLDFPSKPMNRTPVIDRSIINATYKGFIEIVLQNNDTTIQNFHMDGYSFFVVGMDYGEWTENSRGSYNKWDAIFRSTTQVFPGGWTAILVSLDNVGSWNLRAENLDRWYLGQETYLRIINPEENGDTEMAEPANVLFCGPLKNLQKWKPPTSAASCIGCSYLFTLLMGLLIAIFTCC